MARYATSLHNFICDSENDLPFEEGLFAGDEAFIKSNNKTYVRTVKGEWIEKGGGMASSPPSGKCKVTNLYVDPDTGKLTVEYDNNPVE